MPEEIAVDINDSGLINFLHEIPEFSELTIDEIKALARYIFRLNYQAGEYLFTEQDKGKRLYIVEDGDLVLEFLGQEITNFHRKDLFGEVAFIDDNTRMGSVKALKPSGVLYIDGENLLNENKLDIKIAFKVYKKLAQKVTSYLRSNEQTTTMALIQGGESQHVEFKPSLRSKNKKINKRAKHEVVRSIVAFLNSDGGTLFIGVEDNKEIRGLENFPDDEAITRCIKDIIKNMIGNNCMTLTRCSINQVDDKKVLRVDCKPAPSPVFINDGEADRLYIRVGAETEKLSVRDGYEYIQYRFTKPLIINPSA